MTDKHTTHTTASSHLDALESELDQVDPADAPAIAEEIAAVLSDSLDAAEAGSSTTGDPDRPHSGPEAVGESRS